VVGNIASHLYITKVLQKYRTFLKFLHIFLVLVDSHGRMLLKLTLVVDVEFDCTVEVSLIQILMGYHEHGVLVGNESPQDRTHIVSEIAVKVTEQLIKEDDVG